MHTVRKPRNLAVLVTARETLTKTVRLQSSSLSGWWEEGKRKEPGCLSEKRVYRTLTTGGCETACHESMGI